MGILNAIKKAFQKDQNTAAPAQEKGNRKNHWQNLAHIRTLSTGKYKDFASVPLEVSEQSSWDSFFSREKENPRFPGFTHQSRRKFKHIYHNDQLLVAEAAKAIEVLTPSQVKSISYKGTTIEKFHSVAANEKAVILHQKNSVALLNLSDDVMKEFVFDWQPHSFALGNDFWLVGTRETYDGPGELYCFSMDGNLRWAIRFTEKFSSVFGEMSFFPYTLSVSEDSSDILVGCMDRLYRLDVSGELQARIAVSDLKKKDLEAKYEQSLPTKEPETEEEAIRYAAAQMAADLMKGFNAMDLNSPYSSFTHDPETDRLFLLEDKGRLSAWSPQGDLLWVKNFKNESRFLDWVDDKLIISFDSGDTFWLDRQGDFLYSAKLPMQAASISKIPNKASYLMIAEDHRLYELNKETGQMIKGTSGHPGMALFQINGQNTFFDGEGNSQGYFWLSPQGRDWEHLEAKTFEEIGTTSVDTTGVAPEISATRKFKRVNYLEDDEWFGSRVVDTKRKRAYVVEQYPQLDWDEYRKLTDAQRRKRETTHFLTCYDLTNSKKIWQLEMVSSMYSLYASPDKKTLFTSAPKKDEITYLPGTFYVISDEGEVLKKKRVDAHGFQVEFQTEEKGLVRFASERGKGAAGALYINTQGNWDLKVLAEEEEEDLKPFGVGLNEYVSDNYRLERIDKKKYTLQSAGEKVDLNLKAAIYEAQETPSGDLAFRSGTRLIPFYNRQLEKKGVEIKEEKNILSFATGDGSLAVVSKEEIRGYDLEGHLKWRFSPIPKATHSEVVWCEYHKLYLWVLGNSNEKLVATLSEEGKVIRSQSFNDRDYHRDIEVYPDDCVFIAQSNSVINLYEID
ncbi:ornithine cyclodeaminase [Halobacillus seohaensis]|uniref:Ornithine cyclodeaminase n=1 Tax=Halobacillus seohaensis TaxID=447421 RepID=A0ABW2EJ74_9BACI